MKKVILLSILLAFNIMFSQVGINTNTPNSTLTIEGSLEANYREVTTSSYTLVGTDHYVTYNGSVNSTFTLPSIGIGTSSFTGRIYKIKNVSAFNVTLQASGGNLLRLDNSPVSTFIIPAGAYVEVVNNANTTAGIWDLSYSGNPKINNVEIYGTQLQIPPHAGAFSGAVLDWSNHANSSYDSGSGSDLWWIVSKTSSTYVHNSAYHNASKMTIVYEYQGTPFNVTNMYPILTAGNDSSFPDVFTASFVSLANNGTAGRTRLTVTISRVDYVGANGSNLSNWSGTFLLNVLLARKTN